MGVDQYNSLSKYFIFLKLKNWKSIKAEMLSSTVKEIERPEVYVKIKYYYPEIIYRYYVNGIKIDSDVITVDKKAIEFENKYEAEKALEYLTSKNMAYYNPVQPCLSVLIKSPYRRNSHYCAIALVGVLLISISVGFFL